jgi:integrase
LWPISQDTDWSRPLDTAPSRARKACRPGKVAPALRKPWQRVRGTAGLDDLRIHDLRHSFASIAVSGGDSLYLVGKVLGHRQSRTTERYAHLRDDPLRAVPGVMPGQDGKAGSLIELQS